MEKAKMTKEQAEKLANLIVGVAPRYRESGLGKVLVEMAEAPERERNGEVFMPLGLPFHIRQIMGFNY